MSSKYLDEFLICLEEERFYDAHEALEHIWFPRRFEDNNEIKLLRGYINAAVSFELLKRGRKDSAKKVYSNYLKYKLLRLHISSFHAKKYEEIEQKIENIQRSKND
ncbi:MAG: DUF309 domain-containing protein [Thiovulaceae bacterium]|nr:DUF309 domain-containing protein [Sulfurimonadaceae bacterium]